MNNHINVRPVVKISYTSGMFGFSARVFEVFVLSSSKSEPRHEKTNILVSDLVRHKPGCTAVEDG